MMIFFSPLVSFLSLDPSGLFTFQLFFCEIQLLILAHPDRCRMFGTGFDRTRARAHHGLRQRKRRSRRGHMAKTVEFGLIQPLSERVVRLAIYTI